jgi:hypothetical protein
VLLLILTEAWKVLQNFGAALEFHKSFGPHFIEYTLGFAKILYRGAASNLDGHLTYKCKFCILRYQTTLRRSLSIRVQKIHDKYPLSKLHY